ncbi:hypothetical protein FACS189426_16500 [Bacteroidia bacterium]|nr:hypothetical protein FACS189426_16500 [Bacteroidia bacterium]
MKPGKVSDAKPEEFYFEYVTNIDPTKDNIIELCYGGRLRWKVENRGGDVLLPNPRLTSHRQSHKIYNTDTMVIHTDFLLS